MTPNNNFSGSGEDADPHEPVFNWGLTPEWPEEISRQRATAKASPPEPELSEPEPPADGPPTEAMDVSDLPTGVTDVSDLPTAALSVSDLPTAAMAAPTRRQLRTPDPIDSDLEGATEVLAARPMTAAGPEDESVDHDPVSSLFGDDQFVEYEAQPLISTVPAVIGRSRQPAPPRPPIPRGQLIGISIAAGLVAALALTALFLAGVRLGPSVAPAAVATPTPTATATVAPPTVGPLNAGTYLWNELLGGECLEPFTSAWQDEYTVVDCAKPHAGQLLTRGEFDDAAAEPYPGAEELAARTATACTTDAVLNFAAAQPFADLQVAASFAANADDWAAGQRDYYCFATRSGDEPLTGSVSQP